MPHLGRLGLHDQLNAVDVQAARGHVGGHQDVEARLPERLQRGLRACIRANVSDTNAFSRSSV